MKNAKLYAKRKNGRASKRYGMEMYGKADFRSSKEGKGKEIHQEFIVFPLQNSEVFSNESKDNRIYIMKSPVNDDGIDIPVVRQLRDEIEEWGEGHLEQVIYRIRRNDGKYKMSARLENGNVCNQTLHEQSNRGTQ